MSLGSSQRPPRLLFTEVGLAELCGMMTDRRLADPNRNARVRRNPAAIPYWKTEAARA
jgi:hypothetical protein